MATETELADARAAGYITPSGTDLISTGDNAISQNAAMSAKHRLALLALVESSRWTRPSLNNPDANTIVTPGGYEVSTTSGSKNLPELSPGVLEVTGDTYMLQRYTTWTGEGIPRSYTRRRLTDRTTWDAWKRTSWAGTSLRSGGDFNAWTEPGAFSVTSASHTNGPVAAVGTLSVMTSGPQVVQMFTTLPGRVYTRGRQSGTWHPWREVGATDEMPPSRSGASMDGARLVLTSPTVAPATRGQYPETASDDGTRLWNGGAAQLRESRDGGTTWNVVSDLGRPFSWVRQMSDGQLLACVGADPEPRELWRSTGYGSGTVEWTRVLTASAPSVTFMNAWSIDVHGTRVLAAEYGPKMGNASGGGYNGAGADAWARYVYQSTDSGRTFSRIFDLGAYLAEKGRTDPQQQHVHGVAWDPWWSRIWVTFGDDTNGTLYSDDNGDTWKTAYYGPLPQSPHQVVGIVPMPEVILFGTDTAPNGVQRIDRRHGRTTADGTYPIEQAHTINGSALRTHLCQGIRRVPGRDGRPDLVLLGFSSETNPAETVLVGTWDGFGFSTVYRHPENHAAGYGMRSLVALPTGDLWLGMADAPSSRTLMRGTLPALAPATFPPSAHTHDDRYYTEAEVDAKVTAARQYDSGPRRFTPTGGIIDPANTGSIILHRIGNAVYCWIDGLLVIPGALDTWLWPNGIPAGFTIGEYGQVVDVTGGYTAQAGMNGATRHRLAVYQNDLRYVGYLHGATATTVEASRSDQTRRIYGWLPAWLTTDPIPTPPAGEQA